MTEKKESLQPILQILKETAEKFRSLKQEAKVALYRKGDIATCKQKFEERAQLLINLPNRLASMMKSVDSKIKQKIVHHTEYFATSAQEALEEPEMGDFLLGALLTRQDSKIGDKNDLEKLIASLEE